MAGTGESCLASSREPYFTFQLQIDQSKASQWLEIQQQLHPHHQIIASVLAYLIAPVTLSECVDLLRRNRIEFTQGLDVYQLTQKAVEQLIQVGFAKQYHQYVWCDPSVQPWLVQQGGVGGVEDRVQLAITAELAINKTVSKDIAERYVSRADPFYLSRYYRLFHLGIQVNSDSYFNELFSRESRSGTQQKQPGKPQRAVLDQQKQDQPIKKIDRGVHDQFRSYVGLLERLYAEQSLQSSQDEAGGDGGGLELCTVELLQGVTATQQSTVLAHYFYGAQHHFLLPMSDMVQRCLILMQTAEKASDAESHRAKLSETLLIYFSLSGQVEKQQRLLSTQLLDQWVPQSVISFYQRFHQLLMLNRGQKEQQKEQQKEHIEEKLDQQLLYLVSLLKEGVVNKAQLFPIHPLQMIIALFSLGVNQEVRSTLLSHLYELALDKQDPIASGRSYVRLLMKMNEIVELYQESNSVKKYEELWRWFERYFYEGDEGVESVKPVEGEASHDASRFDADDEFILWVWALISYWIDKPLSDSLRIKLMKALMVCSERQSYWLAGQIALLIKREQATESLLSTVSQSWIDRCYQCRNEREAYLIQQGYFPMTELLEVKPKWQAALQKFDTLSNPQQRFEQRAVSSEERTVWVIVLVEQAQQDSIHCYHVDSVIPKIQKRVKKGGWSKGRAFNLREFSPYSDMCKQYFSQEEMKIVARSLEEHYGYDRHRSGPYLSVSKALPQLIGHPLLFLESDYSEPIQLQNGQPELRVVKERDTLTLSMIPFPEGDAALDKPMIRWQGGVRYQLIVLTEEHLSIAAILEKEGLSVPVDAEADLIAKIQSIAHLFSVQSDLLTDESAFQVVADSRIYLQLIPQQDAIELQLRVYPFGEQGISVAPGRGTRYINALMDGKPVVTERDLKREQANLEYLLSRSPIPLVFNEEYEGVIEGVARCYEFMLSFIETELNELEPTERQGLSDRIILQWPEGKPFDIIDASSRSQISISVSSGQSWFDVGGKVVIDEDQVFTFQEMVELMDQSGEGRFVKLSDNRVLALTEELRKQLDLWSARTNDGLIHPLAADGLEELLVYAELEERQHWRDRVDFFQQHEESDFQVPESLQADLRSYQRVGFQWMSRLAAMGVGACLADDMGLGKTVQTLALLLLRANEGPSLVMAPKSVCHNWVVEAKRFAPDLLVTAMNDLPIAERETFLASLSQDKPQQSGQLIVCSYGIMQSSLTQLKEIEWGTVVADEAQALKNPTAKRSKASWLLNGKFKLALTGTPIENHLGELWSIFRFINPGLLGTLDRFNQRFSVPIEQLGHQQRKQDLKAIIEPFLLRRLKSEVLTELPPRTEILLDVELSDAERAFYEAVRRQAVENLASSGEKGVNKLMIFTQLSRLRQTCCHPRLVTPDSGVEMSSKHLLLMELVEELIDNDHKALIFSQFVTHLSLIRALLDKAGIHYQYLDGSTPGPQRQKAVEDFQRGEGDLFLISLKAGGFGLNLTAADYVIHMDPWWNPAVEDQASDRAHRLGQQKPVTIYRLITKNTIEEKIVQLHDQKRDLATALLSDSDTAKQLSVEELMALIND